MQNTKSPRWCDALFVNKISRRSQRAFENGVAFSGFEPWPSSIEPSSIAYLVWGATTGPSNDTPFHFLCQCLRYNLSGVRRRGSPAMLLLLRCDGILTKPGPVETSAPVYRLLRTEYFASSAECGLA